MTNFSTGEDGVLAMDESQRRAWKIGRRIIAVLFLAGVVSCAIEESGDTVSGPQKSKLEQLEEKVTAEAIMLMDRESFPTIYNKIGRAQFDNANELARWAALAAAESDRCNEIALVTVSHKATRNQIEWRVGCVNGEEFQITQQQAEAARAKYDPAASAEEKAAAREVAIAQPKSARWKGFDEALTVSACDLTVQKAMLVPGSFSTGFSRWTMQQDDDTGRVTIERDYEAENSLSMNVNGRYRCTFDIDERAITGLSIREPDGWHTLI